MPRRPTLIRLAAILVLALVAAWVSMSYMDRFGRAEHGWAGWVVVAMYVYGTLAASVAASSASGSIVAGLVCGPVAIGAMAAFFSFYEGSPALRAETYEFACGSVGLAVLAALVGSFVHPASIARRRGARRRKPAPSVGTTQRQGAPPLTNVARRSGGAKAPPHP